MRIKTHSTKVAAGFISVLTFASGAWASGAAGITYMGRLLDPAGRPVENTAVQFKLQIRTPLPTNCLMYEETRTVNMTGSVGSFGLTMNDGAGTRTDGGSYNLTQIFGNVGSFTFPAANCGGSNVYTPGSTDGRILSVSFNDGSFAGWENLPQQAINYVPSAVEAYQVGGFASSSLLRVADASGQPQSASALTPTNFTDLLALINGTSPKYMTASASGAAVPLLASNPSPSQGSIWFDSTTNTMKFYDGTATQTVGTAGGSVTSVASGTGLTGGPITGSGTLSLATIGAGGMGTKVTYDAYGRVTGAVSLAESDLPALSTAGKVSGSSITSGTIGGSTSISTTGNVNATNVTATHGGFQAVEVWKSDNSHKVTLSASNSLVADYGLTLPLNAGSANQVLQTDGTGNLSWVTPAAGSVTGVTGTLPVVLSGGSAPVISVNAATTSAAGIVQLATDGQSAASVVVQGNDSRLSNSRAPSGTAGGELAGTYPSPTIAAGAVTTAKMFSNPGVNRLVATDATTGATLAPLSCLAGQLLTWNVATGWTCTSQSSLAANGVTSVATGTGLTGGTITTTGTLAVDVGTAANKIVQLDSSAKLPAVDGSALTNLNAANLASGTVAAARMPAFSGDVTTTAGATASTIAKLQGSTLTLTTPASGNFLKFNGTAWVNATPASTDLSDSSGLLRASQMPASCSAGQTLTFAAPTGTWACSAIAVTASNFGSQSANTVLAAPNGAPGTPAFRSLTAADLPSGTVTATGTTGSVPYFNSPSTLANSPVTVSGSNVGIGTTTPNSTIQVAGSVASAYATATGAYTLAIGDSLLGADATSGAFTVTLPSAVGIAGRQYIIKKKDSSANAVTVAASASQTMDGAATYALMTQYQTLTITSDGANWMILGGGQGASIPSGAVMSFDLASCPSGWTAFTAAQDRVVVGAGASYALDSTGGSATGTTSSAGSHTHSGATGSTALTVAQMPAHNHGINDPGHAHSVYDPGHSHQQNDHPSGAESGGIGFADGYEYPGRVSVTGNWGYATAAAGTGIGIYGAATGITIQSNGSGAGHTHTIAADGAHTHTVDVRNPYVALLMCKKL